MQRTSSIMIYRKPCSLYAPYSQGDVVVFGQNAGQQCVAMSLCALIYHNMKGIGNPDDLKQIMFIGNQLYIAVCHNYQDNHVYC